METPQSLRRSNRLIAKEQTKAPERPNQPTASGGESSEPLPVELVEPQIEEQPENFASLPDELFRMVMIILEVWELFAFRRVSQRWKANIEEFILDSKVCLKINVKKPQMIEQEEGEPRCIRTWQPNASVRRLQFEFAYKEPVFDSSRLAEISISEQAFNSIAVKALGRIFPNINTLIIYWDTDDSEQTIDNLVLLLSQFDEFNVLTTFGLIMSGNINNSSTLPKICAAINAHLAPLRRLHLMVPSGVQTTNQQQGEHTGFVPHPPVELSKAIAFCTNFSMTGTLNNRNLLANVCQKPNNAHPLSGRLPKLESLSFPLYFNEEQSRNQFFAALELNNEKFVTVKRLLLVNINQLNDVQRLFKYFPNVEQLYLKYHRPSIETFGFAWIRVLKPLTKLTELSLLNFNFERKSLGFRHVLDHTVNLEQLRKLTVASPDLIICLREASSSLDVRIDVIPRLKPEDISETINMRFPGLRKINLLSGDGELHRTDQNTWQTVEHNIKRDLSLNLPLMPELKVNIQLRHSAMYNKFLALPDEVQANYTNAIAVSEARYLDNNFAATIDMIEQRIPRDDLFNEDGFEQRNLVGFAIEEDAGFRRQIQAIEGIELEEEVPVPWPQYLPL